MKNGLVLHSVRRWVMHEFKRLAGELHRYAVVQRYEANYYRVGYTKWRRREAGSKRQLRGCAHSPNRLKKVTTLMVSVTW